jgi:hypothetical protein
MWGAMLTDPTQLIDSSAYPTIMFKGDEDGGIPDSAGHFDDCPNYPMMWAGPAIYDRLVAVNDKVVYHFLPQANHPAYDNQFCVEQASCFLKAIMQGRPYSGQFIGYQPSCQ